MTGTASALFEAENALWQVTRSANNTQEITFNEGLVVKCGTVGGSGTLFGSISTTTFRFDPTYTGCTVPGIGSAEVLMNGCGYTFTSGLGSTSMTTHIVCPEGATITITIISLGSSICTLHFGPQTPSGVVTGTNLGSGTTREVKVALNLNAIAGSRTGSSLCGPSTSSSGTYLGQITMTGEDVVKAHAGFFMD